MAWQEKEEWVPSLKFKKQLRESAIEYFDDQKWFRDHGINMKNIDANNYIGRDQFFFKNHQDVVALYTNKKEDYLCEQELEMQHVFEDIQKNQIELDNGNKGFGVNEFIMKVKISNKLGQAGSLRKLLEHYLYKSHHIYSKT